MSTKGYQQRTFVAEVMSLAAPEGEAINLDCALLISSDYEKRRNQLNSVLRRNTVASSSFL